MINASFYEREELLELGFKKVGVGSKLHKTCIVVGVENISIGDNVRIDGFTSIIASGKGFLNLGSHIHIASHCHLGAGAGINMDDFSGLAYGTQIHSMSDDYDGHFLTNSTIPVEYKNIESGVVYIGKHSIIGASSVILPGIRIKTGCSVGAMSLVNKCLDEWSIYVGCPVKKIRDRTVIPLELEEKFIEDWNNRV
jgi:galactoside O-acetyltransferase